MDHQYLKQLEEQNDELQKKLAVSEETIEKLQEDLNDPFELSSKRLEADMELAWAYHSNVAMCIKDFSKTNITHRHANETAAGIMMLLYGVDMTKHRYYKNL